MLMEIIKAAEVCNAIARAELTVLLAKAIEYHKMSAASPHQWTKERADEHGKIAIEINEESKELLRICREKGDFGGKRNT